MWPYWVLKVGKVLRKRVVLCISGVADNFLHFSTCVQTDWQADKRPTTLSSWCWNTLMTKIVHSCAPQLCLTLLLCEVKPTHNYILTCQTTDLCYTFIIGGFPTHPSFRAIGGGMVRNTVWTSRPSYHEPTQVNKTVSQTKSGGTKLSLLFHKLFSIKGKSKS